MNEETGVIPTSSSIYPDSLRKALEGIPQEYIERSEESLRYEVKPTFNLVEIKRKFWTEMERCRKLGHGAKFIMANCYRDVVTRKAFEMGILKSSIKMAWITTPLVAYETITNSALTKAVFRYEELLNIDINTMKKKKDPETGDWVEYNDVCPKKAKILLDTIKNLEERVKGLALQRQININATDDGTDKNYEMNMDSIEAKIKELESKLGDGKDKSDRVLPEAVDYITVESAADNGRALPDKKTE
jgi:hypothetical protein